MARSREKERDNGRRGNDISIFILCGYFFSSIHGIITTIKGGAIDFVLGGLTRRREKQRLSRVDCSQSETSRKEKLPFPIACIHTRLAHRSVWTNRCQRPILPFSVFLPVKSRPAKPRNFHFVSCRRHFDYDLANNSSTDEKSTASPEPLVDSCPAILLQQG